MPSLLLCIRRLSLCAAAILTLTLILASPAGAQVETVSCERTLHADVVAFDQVFFWNRMGAIQPQGMMYALRRDVVPISGTTLSPGNVRLRPDKRPRPMVLRMNVGDCLEITFQNLLDSPRRDEEQPATRWASLHAIGIQELSVRDDGSYVGKNSNSIANVGDTIVYTLLAPDREGEHVIFSTGATNGGDGDGGSTNPGLFGAIIVEPRNARWYRSQVTEADLKLATVDHTPSGHPVLDYEKRYPTGHPQAGRPSSTC